MDFKCKRPCLPSYGQAELIAKEEALIGIKEPSPKYVRKVQFIQFEGYVRYWKFRTNVLHLYNHTCCISGLKVQNGLAHPLVDAYHIQDHAQSGMDHPANGLALCKNLHAAFDAGLISLTDKYQVIVSKDFQESNTAYSLHHLKGQKISLPAQPDYYPDIEYIRFHRKRWEL